MSLDFPRAWELARAAPMEAHHARCSYVQAGGAMLCDTGCPVIADAPEFACPALHGAAGLAIRTDGECGPCTCLGPRCGNCGYRTGALGHRNKCGPAESRAGMPAREAGSDA